MAEKLTKHLLSLGDFGATTAIPATPVADDVSVDKQTVITTSDVSVTRRTVVTISGGKMELDVWNKCCTEANAVISSYALQVHAYESLPTPLRERVCWVCVFNPSDMDDLYARLRLLATKFRLPSINVILAGTVKTIPGV